MSHFDLMELLYPEREDCPHQLGLQTASDVLVYTPILVAPFITQPSQRYTAYRLFMDMQRGIFERFHSMPIARSASLWGHVLSSLVSNAISVAVMILVALIMGFRSPAGVWSWLAVAGILALFTLALTWVAAIAGLSAKTVDGAAAFSYPLIFLPFISSAFVPTESMTAVVRAFAENQPVTLIVDASAHFCQVGQWAMTFGSRLHGVWGLLLLPIFLP